MRNPWPSASFQFSEFGHQPYIDFLCPSLPVSPLLNRHVEFSPRILCVNLYCPIFRSMHEGHREYDKGQVLGQEGKEKFC
jgi:hypothetical protein